MQVTDHITEGSGRIRPMQQKPGQKRVWIVRSIEGSSRTEFLGDNVGAPRMRLMQHLKYCRGD